MVNSKKILIIEDDKDISNLISHFVSKEGYTPILAHDGEEGLWQIKARSPDIIILDLMLPRKDGYEVIRQIKKETNIPEIPIIILTAKSEEIDKIVGLELGADDYITKPFSPRELIARIKAVMRRTDPEAIVNTAKKLAYGKLEIDDNKYEVRYDEKLIRLTSKEYNLLKYLLQHKGVVISRDDLLQNVWGYNYVGTTRTVDVHISRLRKKIPYLDRNIQHIKDIGYKFLDE